MEIFVIATLIHISIVRYKNSRLEVVPHFQIAHLRVHRSTQSVADKQQTVLNNAALILFTNLKGRQIWLVGSDELRIKILQTSRR